MKMKIKAGTKKAKPARVAEPTLDELIAGLARDVRAEINRQLAKHPSRRDRAQLLDALLTLDGHQPPTTESMKS